MKTSELTGAALDWAVAKAEGRRVEYDHQYTDEIKFEGWWQLGPNHWQPLNGYSTDWAKGGPIIEREGISTVLDKGDDYWQAVRNAESGSMFGPGICGDNFQTGPTPLIAAMRCYCRAKLGEEVDVPEGLS